LKVTKGQKKNKKLEPHKSPAYDNFHRGREGETKTIIGRGFPEDRRRRRDTDNKLEYIVL